MKMRYFLLAAAFLGSVTLTAQAQSAPTSPPVPTVNPSVPMTAMNSNANQFAEQSGVIAGTAQACGQNVSTLTSRTIEVINALTTNPAEQQMALQVYEKILAQSQENQLKNNVLKCSDVLASYNSLPLLQPDYKEKVLPAMAKMGNLNG